jgi:hypothetical protein
MSNLILRSWLVFIAAPVGRPSAIADGRGPSSPRAAAAAASRRSLRSPATSFPPLGPPRRVIDPRPLSRLARVRHVTRPPLSPRCPAACSASTNPLLCSCLRFTSLSGTFQALSPWPEGARRSARAWPRRPRRGAPRLGSSSPWGGSPGSSRPVSTLRGSVPAHSSTSPSFSADWAVVRARSKYEDGVRRRLAEDNGEPQAHLPPEKESDLSSVCVWLSR